MVNMSISLVDVGLSAPRRRPGLAGPHRSCSERQVVLDLVVLLAEPVASDLVGVLGGLHDPEVLSVDPDLSGADLVGDAVGVVAAAVALDVDLVPGRSPSVVFGFGSLSRGEVQSRLVVAISQLCLPSDPTSGGSGFACPVVLALYTNYSRTSCMTQGMTYGRTVRLDWPKV
jgi:hypothetical protein